MAAFDELQVDKWTHGRVVTRRRALSLHGVDVPDPALGHVLHEAEGQSDQRPQQLVREPGAGQQEPRCAQQHAGLGEALAPPQPRGDTQKNDTGL